MKISLRLRLALVASASVAAASPARAEDAAPNARAVDAAREAFEKGLKQYDANDAEGARISWAESYAAFPSITTLRNLAGVEYETGHCVDALKHLRTYERSPKADQAYLASELPRIVKSCNAQVAHVRVLVPAGVAVTVDGKRAADLADVLDVPAGEHVVAARGGDVNESRTVKVAAGETVELRFGPALLEAGGAPSSPPRAEHEPARDTFWTPAHAWAVGLGVVAVAAFAVGAGFGVQANSERSTAQAAMAGGEAWSCAGSTSASCSTLQSANASQRRDAIASDVGIGAGVAFAVAAGVAWFLPARPRHTGSLWVAPAIERASGALVIGGRF